MRKRNLMRNLLSVLTGVALLSTLCVPCGVLAEDDDTTTFDDGILTYTVTSGIDVEITSCVSSATNVSIMPEIDGYNIVSIGEDAFSNCTSLQSVTIPYTVTSIGEAAFYGCTALKAITIPDAVTKIENGTFFDCEALTTVDLGSGVTEIGDMAFGYCTALEELTIPEQVTTIGDEPFYYDYNLSTIHLPEGLTTWGDYMFYGCASLESVDISAKLEDIGAIPFLGCSTLKTLNLSEDNQTYALVDGNLYNAEQSVLYVYPAGKTEESFTVPDGVLVVYAGAFLNAANLTSITFNQDLQYIGEMAFDFCTGLTDISIPESVETIGDTAFADCTALTSVTFEGDQTAETDNLIIGSYAFYCDDALKQVTLPKRVSEIGEYAFGCTESETTDDEGETTTEITELTDFTLIGYTGAASDYVKDCEADITFQRLDIDWKGIIIPIVVVAALVVIIIIAIGVIRKSMMTKEEREALEEADAARKVPLSQRGAQQESDDGYKPMLEDEIREEEGAETAFSYEDTLPSSMTHSIGHATMPVESAEEPENSEESENSEEE